MAELRPRDEHRNKDWAALGSQLNAALPQQHPKRKQRMIIPILLMAALLSTNAMWWHSNQSNQLAMKRLETKLESMQSALATTAIAPQTIVRRDTIWKTVYVQARKNAGVESSNYVGKAAKNLANFTDNSIAISNKTKLMAAAPNPESAFDDGTVGVNAIFTAKPANADDATTTMHKIAEFEPLELPMAHALKIPARHVGIRTLFIPDLLLPEAPVKVISKKIAHTLQPKFYKIGASAGWLNAVSKQLMHEGGIAYNLNAEIGFSRHLSIIAEFGLGKMHYKAHSPDAILGSPMLPMLPSTGHHYLEMDVSGQRIQQFGLGLRYTFSQVGKSRPFLGMSWGGQKLQPFSIQYEIQHEPSGTIEKSVFNISSKTQIKNLVGINAGFEIPLSNRLNFILQGFYQRQWKKPNGAAPDFRGVRAGINLSF